MAKPVPGAPILILAALIALAGAACELPPSFGPEYDDTTINFIASLPLAAPPAYNAATELDQSAVWDWAWRGQTGTTPFEYMTLNPAGTVGTTVTSGGFSLASDEPVWRMELVNLAGDPYLEVGPHSGWESIGVASITPEYLAGSHGRFLKLTSNNDHWAGFNPNFAGFILDDPSIQTGATYRFAAHTTKTVPIRYIIGNQTGVTFGEARSATPILNEVVLETFPVDGLDIWAMFAVDNAYQEVDLDDIRIARYDTAERSGLRLRLRPADTYPDLAPGKYEFSLWIRIPDDTLPFDDDPGRKGLTGSTEATMPFASKTVRLEMRQIGFLEPRVTPLRFFYSFDTSSVWQRIALRMGDGNMERFILGSDDAVIELFIYPYDTIATISPGSLLIAAPSLRYFRDGYTD